MNDVMKNFKTTARRIIGCDPGPEHSAFALVEINQKGEPIVADVAYIPNRELRKNGLLAVPLDTPLGDLIDWGFSGFDEDSMPVIGACEKCGVRFMGANAMVFETCAMFGEIRHGFRQFVKTNVAFTPTDWRYILMGKGNTKDSDLRSFLLDFSPDCDKLISSYSKTRKKELGLKKPITSHLRDAVGVALACGLTEYRAGRPLSDYPEALEVHCG